MPATVSEGYFGSLPMTSGIVLSDSTRRDLAAHHAHTTRMTNVRQWLPDFLNRLSETLYKWSGGTHLRMWGVGVRWGSAAPDFEGGTPPSQYAHAKPHRQDIVGLTDVGELVF